MGVGVGVCPHAVEQRANRITPATAGPAILERIQLRAIFLAMVLLFLFLNVVKTTRDKWL
jgi:hypothetical protein